MGTNRSHAKCPAHKHSAKLQIKQQGPSLLKLKSIMQRVLKISSKILPKVRVTPMRVFCNDKFPPSGKNPNC